MTTSFTLKLRLNKLSAWCFVTSSWMVRVAIQNFGVDQDFIREFIYGILRVDRLAVTCRFSASNENITFKYDYFLIFSTAPGSGARFSIRNLKFHWLFIFSSQNVKSVFFLGAF